MKGKTKKEAEQELVRNGVSPETIRTILPHKVFEGNRPTNSIVVPVISPYILGILIGASLQNQIFSYDTSR